MAAEFLYPTNGNYSNENNNRMINVFDTLYVQYRSSWSAVNLTLVCNTATTSTQRVFFNVPSNPILASGTYKFGSIDAVNFSINQYPTECNFKFTRFGDNDNALSGEFFWVTSSSASSTTYQPTSTPPTASTLTTGQATIITGTSTPTSNSLSSPATAQSSLSTGAQAGIGVGVAAAVLIIMAMLFYILRLRKQIGKHGEKGAERVELSGESREVARPKMELFAPHPQHEMQG